jgi:hypothetical protein
MGWGFDMPAVCRADCADGVSSCGPGRPDQIDVSGSSARLSASHCWLDEAIAQEFGVCRKQANEGFGDGQPRLEAHQVLSSEEATSATHRVAFLFLSGAAH